MFRVNIPLQLLLLTCIAAVGRAHLAETSLSGGMTVDSRRGEAQPPVEPAGIVGVEKTSARRQPSWMQRPKQTSDLSITSKVYSRANSSAPLKLERTDHFSFKYPSHEPYKYSKLGHSKTTKNNPDYREQKKKMTSSQNKSANLFSIGLTERDSGQKIYINYVSDPSEGNTNFKLPEEEAAQMNDMVLQYMVYEYLINRYGEEMPAIYLTEDGKDLVMDFHIFEGHVEAIKKMSASVKQQFVQSTRTMLMSRVLLLVSQKCGWMAIPRYDVAMLEEGVKMAPGERATIERISQLAQKSS